MDLDQSLGLKKERWYDRIVLNIATAIFILMLLLTTIQITVRILNLPISGGAWWTEPLARYSLMVGTYAGAAVASRNQEHIKMTILTDQLAKRSPSVSRAIDALAQVLTIVFLIFLAYAGLRATLNNWGTPMIGVKSVPQSVIYGMITASIGLMIVYETMQLWHIVTDVEFYQQHVSRTDHTNKEGE